MNAGGPRPWQFGESSPEPARVVLTTAPHPPVVSVAYREIGPLHIGKSARCTGVMGESAPLYDERKTASESMPHSRTQSSSPESG